MTPDIPIYQRKAGILQLNFENNKNFYPNDQIYFTDCTSITNGNAEVVEESVCSQTGKYSSVSYYNTAFDNIFVGFDYGLDLSSSVNTFCLCYKPFFSKDNFITLGKTNYAKLIRKSEDEV